MVNWEDFVIRRNINFEEFKQEYNIETKDDLINCCSRFGIRPPGDAKLNSLFPERDTTTVEVEQITNVEEKVEEKVQTKKYQRSKK